MAVHSASGHTTAHEGEAHEATLVRSRFARRLDDAQRYSPVNTAVLLATQSRQRVLAEFLVRFAGDLSQVRLVEVGCGSGGNLLELLRLGFTPAYLQGIELMESSAERARMVLPPSVRIATGDAAAAVGLVASGSQDIVFQSTVFSSLLDNAFQQRLADTMWGWLRPGGAVLWYDFTINNPRNPDVRGVPVPRIRELFPTGRLQVRRVTLAPPLGRAAAQLHPALYVLLDAFVWLRTHVLVWVEKPS